MFDLKNLYQRAKAGDFNNAGSIWDIIGGGQPMPQQGTPEQMAEMMGRMPQSFQSLMGLLQMRQNPSQIPQGGQMPDWAAGHPLMQMLGRMGHGQQQPVGSPTAAAATGRPVRGDRQRHWDNPNHPRYGHVRPPRGPRGA
jgi:hypothetical protein